MAEPIRFRRRLEMEGIKLRRDTGDKYMNYYTGILLFFGSLGQQICGAMAYEWEKEVDRLRSEYQAFKEMYSQLTRDEKRNAWRCFAHAHKYYRKEWSLDLIEHELILMKCPPSLIEKIIEYFRSKNKTT